MDYLKFFWAGMGSLRYFYVAVVPLGLGVMYIRKSGMVEEVREYEMERAAQELALKRQALTKVGIRVVDTPKAPPIDIDAPFAEYMEKQAAENAAKDAGHRPL